MVDVELFGGRRGYLQHIRSRALYALGTYRFSRRISWALVNRLVFVCMGNICRSPYAAARARALGLNAFSLGLDAADGAAANAIASTNAISRGLDLSIHRSRRLRRSLVAPGDLIFLFEPNHLRAVRQENLVGGVQISLMGVWASPIRPYIQDPYGRTNCYFQQCFSIIDDNLCSIRRRLEAAAAPAIICDNSVIESRRYHSCGTLAKP